MFYSIKAYSGSDCIGYLSKDSWNLTNLKYMAKIFPLDKMELAEKEAARFQNKLYESGQSNIECRVTIWSSEETVL